MAFELSSRTLGDYVTLRRGKTYSGKLVGLPGPALLGLGSIHPGGGFREGRYKTFGGECPEALTLYPGDLYVALKGATKDGSMVGSIARVPTTVQSGRLTQDTVKLKFLKPNSELARHIYWVIRTPQYRAYCGARITGSAQVGLSREDLLAYPIPPVTDSRRTLVELLECLDDKNELNRKMNRTLEEMAQALFRSWFIDFDGVPPEDLVDSELGSIPRGWEVSTLREHISLDKGLSYKGKFLTETGTPMVNLKCVKANGGFRRDATKPYSGQFKSRHEVHPGDIVIANTDLTQARDILGCPAFVPPMPNAEAIITLHHTFAVRFIDEASVGRNFLYHLLLSPMARGRCRGFATGTTVLAVPRDALLDFEFALPASDRLQEFERLCSSLRGRIETNEDEAETLVLIRDTLLPKLISGEIRVAEAEKQAEAVL